MTQNPDSLIDPTNPLALEPIDPNKDYLAELVGEGKKFVDNAALARAKAEADRHILRLENEAKGIKADLDKRITMEELLTKLSLPKPQETVAAPATEQSGTSTETAPPPTPTDVQALVQAELKKLVSANTQQTNLDTARGKLREVFGDNYPDVLTAKAKELGVGLEFLDGLAKTQPTAFLKLVEADKPAAPVSTGTPRMGTIGDPTRAGPVDPGFKNQSYYLKLQSTDPKKFWDSKTQLEMHDMAMKDPAKYFA
jgi:hypothetical protein